MTADAATARAGATPLAYLLLDVAGTPCALPRSAVSEILPLPDLHRPPATGGSLAGFLNLGGEPVPVIDLAALFGLRPGGPTDSGTDPYAHIVLAADRATGFLVDRVADLVTVAPDALRPVPDDRTLNGCVEAGLSWHDRLVHVLGAGRILTAEERARIAALTASARERLAGLGAV
ncbi:chemotaxis protein CheW [Methylobacterium sp. A54F]